VLSLDELYARACNNVSDVFLHCPMIKELASRCQHVTELGLNSLGICVSVMAGQPSTFIAYGKNKEKVDEIIKEIPDDVGRTHLKIRAGDSLKIQIEETEMLIIDTYHTYSQLNNELLKHAGNATKYIVIISSYAFALRGEDGSSPGVMDAVVEFVAKNDRWEIIYNERKNNGMLVLQREPPTGPDFDRLYSMVTYDIPDVKWVERYVMGMTHPNEDLTGEEREEVATKQIDKLNRALRYGVILGIERNFSTIFLEDKEVLTGYLVYHIGFRHRPIGK